LLGKFFRGFLNLIILASLLPMVNTCGATPLLSEAKIWPDRITPNADGDTDVAVISYRLNRNAYVSIYLLDEKNQPHYFRKDQRRSIGEHTVYFGGVVQDRVLPDGRYTWVIEATDDYGKTEKAQGTLIIADADTNPPQLLNFTVYPEEFTPNQDGLDDRVTISYYLTKKAETHVYLVGPDGKRYPLVEKERDVKPGERGIHIYDYEGGSRPASRTSTRWHLFRSGGSSRPCRQPHSRKPKLWSSKRAVSPEPISWKGMWSFTPKSCP